MKTIKIKTFLIGFFILGIINIPYISWAESQIQVQEGEITVKTNPRNPQPYQDVTIELSSYATDLNKSIITWQSGSKILLSGIGKKSYSFKTGEAGSVSSFNVNITPIGSMNSINKSIDIYPSEIELTWEVVDGYTPPFYKGKSIPVKGSLIKIIAIPNTKTIKSGNGSISYTWRNDDSVVESASGYNKNSYTFKNSIFDKVNKIAVEASSVAGNYQAENTIDIPLYQPKLLFYSKSPTDGIIYSKALYKEATLDQDEVTLVAEPYFISLKNNENNISYSWKINNKDVQTPTKKTEITLRPKSRGGYANIKLSIENASELFQNISEQLKLTI